MLGLTRKGPVARPKARRNAVQDAPQPPATEKGKRRREAIKASMRQLLEQRAYNTVRIGDITAHAGIPVSVFYHYFRSKEDLTFELLAELHDQFEKNVLSSAPFTELFAGIQRVCRTIFDLFGANSGLVRALGELDEAGLAGPWEALTLKWQRVVAEAILSDMEKAQRLPGLGLASAYALSGMCNAFAHAYFVTGNPELRAEFPDPGEAADFVAGYWFRALRLSNPPLPDGRLAAFFQALPATQRTA